MSAPVAFTFGCPRAGTTFLYRSVSGLEGAVVSRVHEGSVLHPCRSSTGLIELSKLFRDHVLALVRIVRHPVEIVESFRACRDDRFGDEMAGLRQHSDDDVVRLIGSESRAVEAQRPHFRETNHDHHLIEVRYDDLGDPEYRRDVAERVVGALWLGERARIRLEAKLARFGKAPVRSGRLSAGIDSVMEDWERAVFRDRLAHTIEREGYA